jgi:organic hydroperoxide reductase OsmC/OhrA
MNPLPHLYDVTLSSTPKGYATLLTDGVPALRSAPPKDFGGPGDAWSPEHLLLASVKTCFLFTFRAVAEASKFDFLSLEVLGSGTVDRKDGAPRFTDIILRSRLAFQRAQIRNGPNECLRRAKPPALSLRHLLSLFVWKAKSWSSPLRVQKLTLSARP